MKKFSPVIFPLLFSVSSGFAPLHKTEKAIPGQYVVVLQENVEMEPHLVQLLEMFVSDSPGNEFLHQYSIGSFKGYSVRCTRNILSKIRESPLVKSVTEDGMVSAFGQQDNPPSWGLDRVSQRSLPLDQIYHYPDSAGSGVNVYTLDTGIYLQHNDFGGRATWGITFSPGSGDDDVNGHGTHVSGVMGGTSYGIAKLAHLVAVKVLGDNGAGSYSDVIAGVNWVVSQHSSNSKSVANLSIGGGIHQPLDDAITAAISQGVHIAVASGNSNADGCDFSPCRAQDVVCVASSTITDARRSSSNWGSCIGIHAPGESITSAYIGNPDARATFSGSSISTPHVAGVMALYLAQNKVPSLANLQLGATRDVLSGVPEGTANLLLFSDNTL